MNKIKTIFIGTSDFGIPSLKALNDSPDFDILGIITQPDKPAGRKQTVTSSPVKELAIKKGLNVWQPEKVANFQFPSSTKLGAGISNFDLIILIAYAQLIPQNILNLPKFGCLNVHASLLPKCRGAACIQKPIIDGEETTGVTIMKMDEGFDTGPILAQKEIPINSSDTTGEMFKKLAQLGAEILLPTVMDYIAGKIIPKAQTGKGVSYVGQITKQDGKIDWHKPAIEIERFVRAMTPWPGAWTNVTQHATHNTQQVKIIEVENIPISSNNYKDGEIFCSDGNLAVQCGENALVIKKLQLSGKKPITDKDFICGHSNLIGQVLG